MAKAIGIVVAEHIAAGLVENDRLSGEIRWHTDLEFHPFEVVPHTDDVAGIGAAVNGLRAKYAEGGSRRRALGSMREVEKEDGVFGGPNGPPEIRLGQLNGRNCVPVVAWPAIRKRPVRNGDGDGQQRKREHDGSQAQQFSQHSLVLLNFSAIMP